MRHSFLTAVVLAGCAGSGPGTDKANGNGSGDTDLGSGQHAAPFCEGEATLDGEAIDPCVKAGATLDGVEPAGVAADWNLSFGEDDCFWLFKLDDVCGDGDVWFGGGASVRWSTTGCGGPASGEASGAVRLSDYALAPDGDGWLVSGQVSFDLAQDGVPLEGSADVVWHVSDPSQSAAFSRCSNDPVEESSSGASVPSKLDVLLVVDNSCSMTEEQAQLAATLPTIADGLDARGVDYQVGVVTTDVADSRQNGKLVQSGGVKFVTPATPERDALLGTLVSVGTGGSSIEQGLLAATRALSEPLLSGANAGFVRDDADLAIVIVSDEEDQSAPRMTGNEFIALANSLKTATKDVSFSSIVGPTPSGCSSPTANAVPGAIYLAVTAGVGGMTLSICDTDWTSLGLGLDPVDPNILGVTPTAPPVAKSLRVIANESTGDRALARDTDWTWTGARVEVKRSGFEEGATLTLEYAPTR